MLPRISIPISRYMDTKIVNIQGLFFRSSTLLTEKEAGRSTGLPASFYFQSMSGDGPLTSFFYTLKIQNLTKVKITHLTNRGRAFLSILSTLFLLFSKNKCSSTTGDSCYVRQIGRTEKPSPWLAWYTFIYSGNRVCDYHSLLKQKYKILNSCGYKCM